MRKRLFFGSLCFLLMIDMTNFTFVVPIMPDFLLSQGVSLSLIGFILSFYQISYFFTSLYMGKNLIHYSKKKVLIIGQISLIISNISLAFVNYNLDTVAIIIVSSILRFLQGISLACVCSAIYSYVPILFPMDLDKKYAIIEISLGSGLALGPVIGGFLYEFLDYTWCFLIITAVYLLLAVFFFPFIIHFKLKIEVDPLENMETEVKNPPLKTRTIIKNKEFVLTFFVFVFSYMAYYLIQPGFSQHVHDYDGSEDAVGMIFGLGDLTYALTGFLLLRFLSKINIKRKYFFLFGGFMSMISLLILGPEHYTYLPQNLIVVTIGMGILGFAQMFYTATLIPEIIDILKNIDENAEGNEEMACGLFNASVAGTEFLGAILGGVLTDNLGFSRGMAIYAMVLLGYLIFFAFARKYPKEIKGVSDEQEKRMEISQKLIENLDSETLVKA